MQETVKIARYRNVPYKVNYKVNGGGTQVYSWRESKGDSFQVLNVPEEVVEWLALETHAFTDGELVIVDENDPMINLIDNHESYKNNSHTRDEIVKFLSGNVKTLKEELKKISDDGEKRFVVNVAKEIKIDSITKQKAIAEWANMSIELLFDEDEEE
ncbi:hypothetical protein BSK66_26735 [Paenibacillus odorifer]|uniref:hypothetical protein n=1 Tax=Paenibacillus TaxID=44249 RepID=UPI0003E28E87|nr:MULTISPECIES: hypothetical protein [Paenibacillus]ETT49345.1 hypothetical protein C171_23770 [Paenibacillus sp. FSL H8-237]OME49557.1 hypothetical protein BSK66_26735 [Paenibacillus odorifer]